MRIIKNIIKKILPWLDIIILLLLYPAAWLMKRIRSNITLLPLCKNALMKIGVFPIIDHYYEPLFHPRHIEQPLTEDRNLPGIDYNIEYQLNILEQFHFSSELAKLPKLKNDNISYYPIINGEFASGDAEYWYNIIRLKKPRRIYEVGSGYSTLMAIKAIKKNKEEDPDYNCKHICIEPYQKRWLEETDIILMRKKVEEVHLSLFQDLTINGIFFIDSSHIIRPQGDVVIIYLQILPSLKKGVIVHSHDIFSPKDYLEKWILEDIRFWNEQYLLEAFLTSNTKWKIIGALNFLHHHYYEKLKAKCPYLTKNREPGSFYIQKTF